MNPIRRLSGRYRSSAEPLRSERRLELLALALLLIFVLQAIALVWTSLAGGRVEPVLPAADSMRVAVLLDPGAIVATDSAQVRSRPLFWPSRRPVPEGSGPEEAPSVVEQSQQNASKLKGLSVTGVFGSGSAGGAIVTYKGREKRLQTGDSLGSWTLESVAPGEAVFVDAGVRDVRRLLPRPVAWTRANPPAQAVKGGGDPKPEVEAPQSPPTSVARPAKRAAGSSIARTARSAPEADQ